jgi:hypothetical protein
MIHMRWHKDGEWENKEVMAHPSGSYVWKALDNFDLEFAQDVRNVHIGLATDGFTLSVTTQHRTPAGPCLLFHTIFLLLFA